MILRLIALALFPLGLLVGYLVAQGSQETTQTMTGEDRQALYWVAPMDPNYRRDQPGKSPMGMDLVPVYADDADPSAPGTVSIDPVVFNNLGVRTATAKNREWNDTIRTVGYVSYDEDRLVHIHPRVAGWVEKLFVKAAGNPVNAGAPLYELYSPELVNAQEELLLARKRNNQVLIDAARDRLRALQMSPSFIDNLERTGRTTQNVTFRAGQDGVVDNLVIREGFYVEPGTTMMSIGNLDEVWVEAEVFERQADRLRAGLSVTMRLDYLPGRVWEGEVDYVYPTLDPQLRTARVRLRFNNEDGALKPNMFAQVVIHTRTQGTFLTVPREAVIRTGDEARVVLALGDGRFRSVPVDIGRMNESQVVITAGLNPGQQVVTSAQFLLDSESSKHAELDRMNHTTASPDNAMAPNHHDSHHGGHHEGMDHD